MYDLWYNICERGKGGWTCLNKVYYMDMYVRWLSFLKSSVQTFSASLLVSCPLSCPLLSFFENPSESAMENRAILPELQWDKAFAEYTCIESMCSRALLQSHRTYSLWRAIQVAKREARKIITTYIGSKVLEGLLLSACVTFSETDWVVSISSRTNLRQGIILLRYWSADVKTGSIIAVESSIQYLKKVDSIHQQWPTKKFK